MKKSFLMITLLLLIPLTIAAERHTITFDDTYQNPLTVTIPKRDIVLFTFPIHIYDEPVLVNGKEKIAFNTVYHEEGIMVRDIRTTKAGLKVADMTVFIKDAPTPQYTTVKANDTIRLDFEGDSVDDIVVEILTVDTALGVTLRLVPQDISDAKFNPRYYKGAKANPITGGGEASLSFMERTKIKIQDLKEWVSGKLGENQPRAVQWATRHWVITGIMILCLIIITANQRRIRRSFRTF